MIYHDLTYGKNEIDHPENQFNTRALHVIFQIDSYLFFVSFTFWYRFSVFGSKVYMCD